MNTGDLINFVAQEANLTNSQARDAINVVFDKISTALKNDEKVIILQFGTFSIIKRPASTERDPRTGQQIVIPVKNDVSFNADKSLDLDIN